jgi:hypothetical protein
MNQEFKERLKKCESLKQVFDLANEFYDTAAPMGLLSGNIVKSKIPDIIKVLNLKPTK